MDAKKVLGWLALAFLLLWIFISPRSAAEFFQSIGSALRTATENLIAFFQELAD